MSQHEEDGNLPCPECGITLDIHEQLGRCWSYKRIDPLDILAQADAEIQAVNVSEPSLDETSPGSSLGGSRINAPSEQPLVVNPFWRLPSNERGALVEAFLKVLETIPTNPDTAVCLLTLAVVNLKDQGVKAEQLGALVMKAWKY